MSSIQDCIQEALNRTTCDAGTISIKVHLLHHIYKEVAEISKYRPQCYFSIAGQWLLSPDELYILCNINSLRKDNFFNILNTWKNDRNHWFIGDKHYFSLFKLIQSAGFIDEIIPCTLYAMPSSKKGDLC